MANSEIRNALKFVREAEDAVTEALAKSGLTQPQRDLLDEISDFLRGLDTFLVLMDLGESIEKLEQKSRKLADLNGKTQTTLSRLKKVAKAVDQVARAIDALAKAAAILGKAGLLSKAKSRSYRGGRSVNRPPDRSRQESIDSGRPKEKRAPAGAPRSKKS